MKPIAAKYNLYSFFNWKLLDRPNYIPNNCSASSFFGKVPEVNKISFGFS